MKISISKDFSYRREEFGGLFYNFNTRQLLLAKSQITVTVMNLMAYGSVEMDQLVANEQLKGFTTQSVEATLEQLIESGILTIEDRGSTPTASEEAN